MTAEKRLELTLRAVRRNWTGEYPKAEVAISDPDKWLKSNVPFLSDGDAALLELYADALNEIETKKTPGGSAILSALKRMLNESKRTFGNTDRGIDRTAAGEWICASHCRAVRLSRAPENLPKQDERFSYAAATDAFLTVCEVMATNETTPPSFADLKKHIASVKARYPKGTTDYGPAMCYNLPGTPVWVNAELLSEMLILFPAARVFYSTPTEAVVFKATDPNALCTIGILMPMRHRADELNETE